MSFAFSQVEPNRSGQVAPDIGFGSFMGNAFRQGINDGAFPAISRMTEMWLENNDSALFGLIQWEGSQEMSADVANQRAKDAGLRLHFDEPVRASVYAIMADRKEREQQRQFFIENGMTSPGRFVGALGAQMLGSMLNPIDFGTMFLPMVGSTRLAAGAAMLGRSSARRTLQRGILTSHENLVKNHVPFPKFTAAVIDGTAGQALVEIPLLVANLQDQADYGFQDFAINVAAGGLFSGGFRISMDAAMNIFGKVQAHTRKQMFRRALDQFAKDEDTDVHRFVDIDENMLKQQAIFDEAEARGRAKQEVAPISEFEGTARSEGKVPVRTPEESNTFYESLTRSEKETLESHVEGSPQVKASTKKTAVIHKIFDKAAPLEEPLTVYRVVNLEEMPAGQAKAYPGDESNILSVTRSREGAQRYADDMGWKEGQYRIEEITLAPGTRVLALDGKWNTLHREQQELIVDTRGDIGDSNNVVHKTDPKVRKRARQLRENAVRKLIRDEKKAHDPEKKYNELKLQEIQRQIAEGKILKSEDIHRYRHLLVGKKGQEIIDEETKNLEDRIRAATGEVDISTLSPLQRLFLNKVARHYTKEDPQKIKDEGFSGDVVYFAFNDQYKGSFGDNKIELLITPRIAKDLEVDVYDLFLAAPDEMLPTTMHWEKYLVENPPEGMTSAQVRDLAEDPIGGGEELKLDDAYLLQAINKHPELLDQLPIKINRKLTSADIDGFTPQERAFINQSARPDTEGIQAGIDCLINNG